MSKRSKAKLVVLGLKKRRNKSYAGFKSVFKTPIRECIKF